jgi:hypothetical protein
VRHADVALVQQRDVTFGDENAVRCHEAAVQETELIEIFDRRLVAVAAQVRDFVGHFRDVHQHWRAGFGRQAGDRPQVGLIERIGRVRRECRRDQRIAGELLDKTLGVGDAAVRLRGIRRREVDDSLTQNRPQPDLAGAPRDFVLEVIHVGERGHAGLGHFDHAVQPAPVDQLPINQCLFERKDQFPQPVRHIVAQPAEHRHRRVRVRVDEARHHNGATSVEGFPRGKTRRDFGAAQRDNFPVANRHHAVFHDASLVIHRDDVAAGDQQVRGLGRRHRAQEQGGQRAGQKWECEKEASGGHGVR